MEDFLDSSPGDADSAHAGRESGAPPGRGSYRSGESGDRATGHGSRLARRRRVLLGVAAGAALLSAGGLIGASFVKSPAQLAADTAPPAATVTTAKVAAVQLDRVGGDARGARPRHIASQFLAESTALGTLGGLIGTSLGVLTVVVFAAAQNWTSVVNPAVTRPAPLIGSVAGLYPALRAARTSPLAALRHA